MGNVIAWRGLASLLLIPLALLIPCSAQADFGIENFAAGVINRNGTLDFQAGSHPYEYALALTMNQSPSGEPEGLVRAVRLELPPGLVGDPLAIPRCSRQDFEGALPNCPGATQVGIVHFTLAKLGELFAPLYNLVPPPGVFASFGFGVNGVDALELASLRTGQDYGLSETIAPIPVGDLLGVSETIWGVPADPGHDAGRVCLQPDGTRVEGCASAAPEAALLTLPSSCGAPLETRIVVESVQGDTVGKSVLSSDQGGSPAPLVGCEAVPFDPQTALTLESALSDSPTGASVNLHQHQPQGADVRAAATPKDAVIELPEGVAVNPPVAVGLASCSPAQVGLLTAAGGSSLFNAASGECPGASRLGSVEIDTPLVDHPLRGGIYLATPHQNPFDSLLAVYIAVDDEESGVVLKLPGLVEPDPGTGRLTLRLEKLPQLPFEDLHLSFPGGPRAALRTPPVCGAGRTTANLTPWTAPQGSSVAKSNVFRTSVASAGAGACPAEEAQAANEPTFTAGTLYPAAGEASPFVLRLGREDGSQRLASIDVSLPPGVSGRLVGIPPCAGEQIAAGSCPADSEVGTVEVGAGAGSAPLRLTGEVYLAGPYKGAPLSLAIIVPAVAGPLDLGTVSVRVALYVDRETAQVRAVSDPLPTILSGIPLDIRSLALNLDRSGFVLNPTSCEPLSVVGRATSTVGESVAPANRFQVGNCTGLGFAPKVSVRLLGTPQRGAHPRLRATLTTRPGDANLRRVAVTLPRTELLDMRQVHDVCAPGRFAARHCPAASAAGHLRVWTPLLDRPLEGTVFLKGSDGRLPELAAALDGQVEVETRARLDSVKGRLRVTFRALPDVPISRLVLSLNGGKKGLLANTAGVCAAGARLAVQMLGQSGRSHHFASRIRADCAASN